MPLSLTVFSRWRVFLPGELRPATRLGHLRMGVLRHHHAVLRDICLWVCRHVWRYHGGAGQGRGAGSWRERTQNGCTGGAQSTLAATSSPTWKHVHTVTSATRLDAARSPRYLPSNSGGRMGLIIHFQSCWCCHRPLQSGFHSLLPQGWMSAAVAEGSACVYLKRTCLHFAQVWNQIFFFSSPPPSRWPTEEHVQIKRMYCPTLLTFFSKCSWANSTQVTGAVLFIVHKVAEAAGQPGWQCYCGEMDAIHECCCGSEATPEVCFPTGGRMRAINSQGGLSREKIEKVIWMFKHHCQPCNNHCFVPRGAESPENINAQ